MFAYIIFSIVSIDIAHSLKCHGYKECKFTIKFGESLPNQDKWQKICQSDINQIDYTTCRSIITVNYRTQLTHIELKATKENQPGISKRFIIPDDVEKESNLFFLIESTPNKALTINTDIVCSDDDLCAINRTIRLLPQLATMKGRSLNIFKDFQTVLELSSTISMNSSGFSCFDSHTSTTIQCSKIGQGVCRIQKLTKASAIVSDCDKKLQNLRAAVFYDLDPYKYISQIWGWSIHCNQDNCNTRDHNSKILELARLHIEGRYHSAGEINSTDQLSQIVIFLFILYLSYHYKNDIEI